jgi:glycolate oxidase FAD binding subunit
VPPATPPINLPGKWILDWGGAQRWLMSDAPANAIHQHAENVGGYATLFRHEQIHDTTSHRLSAVLATLHQNLKRAFDPDGIINPTLMA